jgi:osmotically-inducible protein OsmY
MLHNTKNKGLLRGLATFDEASYYSGNNFQIGGNDRRSHSFERSLFNGKTSLGLGMIRSDDHILEDVWKLLSQNSVDISHIEVDVRQGVIKLTGKVNSLSDKREVENSIEYIPGMIDIVNDLKVSRIYG